MLTIAIAMQKGGSGKTTTAVNLAAALSAISEYDPKSAGAEDYKALAAEILTRWGEGRA